MNANVVIFNENYEIIANTLTENNGVYTIPTLEAVQNILHMPKHRDTSFQSRVYWRLST